MPQSVRLGLLLLCALGILYVAYGAFDAAMTEHLDDGTLRAFYKQADSFVKNPQGMRDYLKLRLSDNYQRTGNMISSAKDKPDQTTPVNLNKSQSIDMTVQELSMISMKTHEYKIVEIQYTDDKNYAYVSNTESSNGTFNFPLPGGKKIALPFNEAASCIDTWMPEKKMIVMVRSDCTSKIAFLQ